MNMRNKKYVMPIIPAAGLGHLLFTWAEAYRISLREKFDFIHPHWFRIRIGPYIRREKEKMIYRSIMKTPDWGVHPLKGRYIAAFSKKYTTLKELNENCGVLVIKDDRPHSFEGLFKIKEEIKGALYSISKIDPNLESYLKRPFICVEYRSGDYRWLAKRNGFFNLSIREQRETQMRAFTGLDFFIDVVVKLRDIAGWEVPIVLSTDAYDYEVKEFMDLGGVTLAQSDSSLLKLLDMSKAAVTVIGSSNFAAWSWFLGNGFAVFPKGRSEFLYGLGLRGLPHATFTFNDESELNDPQIKEEVRERLRNI